MYRKCFARESEKNSYWEKGWGYDWRFSSSFMYRRLVSRDALSRAIFPSTLVTNFLYFLLALRLYFHRAFVEAPMRLLHVGTALQSQWIGDALYTYRPVSDMYINIYGVRRSGMRGLIDKSVSRGFTSLVQGQGHVIARATHSRRAPAAAHLTTPGSLTLAFRSPARQGRRSFATGPLRPIILP